MLWISLYDLVCVKEPNNIKADELYKHASLVKIES